MCSHVDLSRRNLLTLLVKLDDAGSTRTLVLRCREGEPLAVTAVTDAEKYSARAAGPVLPEHEALVERIQAALA